jgi:hypothetical protein
MRMAIVSRQIVVAGATLVAVMAVSETAIAQTASASTGNCPYWIDSKTGKRVRTVPIGIYREQLTQLQEGGIPNSISGAGGHSYVKGQDGSWIDAATGATVRTVPIGIYREQLTQLQEGGIPNSISGAGGHSYALIPCPPPSQPTSVQTLPVLPFFGFGLGLGHRDHGDDRFQK